MNRAARYLSAYIEQQWDRIKAIDDDWDRSAFKEHLEKIKAKTDELNAATELARKAEGSDVPEPEPLMVPKDPELQKQYARNLLGVQEAATFEEIRAAFTRLNKRSDPSKFPPSSQEYRHAASIQKKVHWALATLTDHMDDTERRFRSLEP